MREHLDLRLGESTIDWRSELSPPCMSGGVLPRRAAVDERRRLHPPQFENRGSNVRLAARAFDSHFCETKPISDAPKSRRLAGGSPRAQFLQNEANFAANEEGCSGLAGFNGPNRRNS
jgi:hypothetical protein